MPLASRLERKTWTTRMSCCESGKYLLPGKLAASHILFVLMLIMIMIINITTIIVVVVIMMMMLGTIWWLELAG